MPSYDPSNVFAKILSGALPCHKVYEDDRTLAFMDVMPRGDGHILVIPKSPARTLFDADPADLAASVVTVQKVARAAMEALGAEGVTIQQFNEQAAGQVVYHLHFHILPRWSGVALRPHTGAMAPSELLAEQADKIRSVLAG